MKKLSETQRDILFFVLGTVLSFSPIWVSFLLDIINF